MMIMMMMMMMMVMMMLMMMMIDEVLFFALRAKTPVQAYKARGHESTWLQAASPQGQRPERVLHGLRWRAPSS